jgi:hypothetical protein
MRFGILFFALGCLVSGCSNASESNGLTLPGNSFNALESDPAAVELADSIIIAAGGHENWIKTKFISWSAPGRKLVWDPQGSRLRMEKQNDNSIYLVNLDNGEGRVRQNGQEVKDDKALKDMLAKGRSIWMHDIYALAMPFRLKEAGVTLKYMGEDSLKGDLYNVLQLTSDNKGTNQDKYKVYVDIKGKTIRYWAYFSSVTQDTASFIRTWSNSKHGNVMLSGDGTGEVKVEDNLPDSTFTEF